jgi:hypothetical protein
MKQATAWASTPSKTTSVFSSSSTAACKGSWSWIVMHETLPSLGIIITVAGGMDTSMSFWCMGGLIFVLARLPLRL